MYLLHRMYTVFCIVKFKWTYYSHYEFAKKKKLKHRFQDKLDKMNVTLIWDNIKNSFLSKNTYHRMKNVDTHIVQTFVFKYNFREVCEEEFEHSMY